MCGKLREVNSPKYLVFNMLNNISIIAFNAPPTCYMVSTNITSTDNRLSLWLLFLSLGFYILYSFLWVSRTKKAFSATPGLLADHGLVTARLFIETATGHIFGNPLQGAWESFDIVFGSGASLDDHAKGLNANWNFLDHAKLGKLTGPFTRDAVTSYNSLWQILYPHASNIPQFDVNHPETFARTHKELEEFLIASPRPTANQIEISLVEYIGCLILAVEKHLGLPKALEIHAAIWPGAAGVTCLRLASMVESERSELTDLQFKTPPSRFYAACQKNIFTKPAVLLRDFSSLIGWQPLGGFVIDATSPYMTQEGVCGLVRNAIPLAGTGVLSLAEGLDTDWLGHPTGKRFCSNPNTSNASPCSVHWNTGSGTGGWVVTKADAHWVVGELVEDKRIQYDDPCRPETIAALDLYIRALKDAYVVTLQLKHRATGKCTTLRYGQVHFDSSKVNARKYVLPTLVEMVHKYDLHAIGGDTNVTASKDNCNHTAAYVADCFRRVAMNVATYPYPIEKTRLPGDLLMNSQTLTKYGTTCEYDGMLAATI
jgi:hypothetical protein